MTRGRGPPEKHLDSHPRTRSDLSADPAPAAPSIEFGSRSTNAERARNPASRRLKFAPLHHPASKFSDISENRSKSARVRAICDEAWTRRAVPGAPIRGMRQDLSAIDIARSMHIRSNSAFCDMGVTGILQPAVHISVRHRVRSSSRGRSNGKP